MTRFQAGSSVVVRDVVGARVWTARAASVVKDTGTEVAFSVVPGAPAKIPSAYDPLGWRGEPRSEVIDELARGDWTLRDHAWQLTRVLTLLFPDVYYSVSLYFQPETDRFLWWYVNFQDPFVRTPIGFDTRDLTLDLVVGPDHAWGWKDEEEFAESIARGLITADEERRVRAAGQDVIALIESGAYPFDASWTAWAPDPAWAQPELGPDWDRVNPQ